MTQQWKRFMILGLAVILIVLSGCATNRNSAQSGDKETRNNRNETQGIRGFEANDGQNQRSGDAVIAMTEHNGQLYVPVRAIADVLQFQTEWDRRTSLFKVGDNDVAYEIKANTTEATIAGKPIRLGSPSVMIDGSTYIPYEELGKIFGDAMDYEKQDSTIRIKANPNNPYDDSGLPDFKDDRNDPTETDIPAAAIALKNIDIDAMLRTAQKYIGVPYDFGAPPYPQSGKFDCSTYTQYIYGKYGVNLPRLSRQQGKVGTAVSRTSLRKGDLLFFYLPGRYKSNEIIGHVGIYMGEGRMIHSSTKPKDGVQITSINKAFWKKTYLSARRVSF